MKDGRLRLWPEAPLTPLLLLLTLPSADPAAEARYAARAVHVELRRPPARHGLLPTPFDANRRYVLRGDGHEMTDPELIAGMDDGEPRRMLATAHQRRMGWMAALIVGWPLIALAMTTPTVLGVAAGALAMAALAGLVAPVPVIVGACVLVLSLMAVADVCGIAAMIGVMVGPRWLVHQFTDQELDDVVRAHNTRLARELGVDSVFP